MSGAIPPLSLSRMIEQLTEIFGVSPIVTGQTSKDLQRIALVGAMTDQFVREAAAQGVDLYITGQFRQPARRAVQETGIVVAEIGHTPSEQWGLRALAGLLQERWADLTVLIAPTI